jgi:integrase
MKVTYNPKKNAYNIIYKDALAELEGGRPYARKQFSAGKTKPTAAERKAKIREYEEWATQQEENSRLAAEAKLKGSTIDTTNGETPVLAIDYIENLKGEDLATTRVKKQRDAAKLHCNNFVKFLKENYKGIYLHQVNKKVALDYIKWLDKQGRSYHYKKARWLRMGYVFNMVINKFEDSEYKYRNPFWALKLPNITNEEAINHKKTFTPELVRLVLKEALEFSHTKRKEQSPIVKFQRWAILYLLTLTGIRPSDIILLKWKQVNLEARTLTITHKKTKKKGINTVIWLTPHLIEFFYTLKELHKTHSEMVCSKEYVFSFHPYNTDKNIEDYLYFANHQLCTNFFTKFREKHNLTDMVIHEGKRHYLYCVYSLRSTVGTMLTWANFNQNSIDYLQGHAPNNTTARFYLNHEANPKAATADLINYMAYRVVQQPLGKIGMRYAYNDKLEEDRENTIQQGISEDIRYNNDGTSLLTTILKEKVDKEAAEHAELVQEYGEEIAAILTHDDSPQD